MCVCACFFFQLCWPENSTKLFSPFKHFFLFFKQIKNRVEGFFHPIFFICLYFIGVGGGENLKKNIWCGLTFVNRESVSYTLRVRANSEMLLY